MSTIQIKSSLTGGNVPSALLDGELAINEVDELLFYMNSSGVIRGVSFDPVAGTNILINGGMELDREHSGSAVAISNSVSRYVVDQWEVGYIHTAGTAVFSANQNAIPGTAPGNNLTNGLRIIATTGLTTPSSGDYAAAWQPVEGYRWEKLNYGTSIARPVSFGFYVYSTVTGTASVAIRNAATTRSYVTNFTVTAANTLQWVVVTIPGDQAGTWNGGFNQAANIVWCFASGTAFKTTANTWTTGNFFATSANTNFFSTNGNQVIVTGATLVQGSYMPPVARAGLLLRSTDEDLRLSQRYYEQVATIVRDQNSTGFHSQWISFVATKRVSPTVSLIGIAGGGSIPGFGVFNQNTDGAEITFTSGAPGSYLFSTIVADARM